MNRRGKRPRKEVMEKVLQALSDGKPHAFGDLERTVNTNWRTIRDLCGELELFGAVSLSKDGTKITAHGRKILDKIRKIESFRVKSNRKK